MALMYYNLVKAIKKNDVSVKNTITFTDSSDISSWAKDGVKYCVENAILSGIGKNKFNPKGKATKEQAIIVTQRLFVKLSDEKYDLTSIFPTEIELTYEYTHDNGMPSIKETLVDYKDYGSYKDVIFKFHFLGNERTKTYRISKESIKLITDGNEENSVTILKNADSWDYKYYNKYNNKTSIIRYMVLSRDDKGIKVQAYTEGSSTTTNYFKYGVGLVRTDYDGPYESYVRELKR